MHEERGKAKQRQQLIYDQQKRLRELKLAEIQNLRQQQIKQQQEMKRKQLEEQQNQQIAARLAHKILIEEKNKYLNDPAPLYPDGSESIDYYNEVDNWTVESADVSNFFVKLLPSFLNINPK